MRVIARTIAAQAVASNTDRVLAAVPIPKGGKLISVTGELHLVGEEAQSTKQFAAYGVSGELVPIVDAETAIAYQNLWDNVIVKSADPVTAAATSILDWDWDAGDASPQIEPGEMDIDALLGLTQGQKEFLAPRLEWVSWAKSRQGGFAAGSPDTYLPSDFKTFRSKKTVVADVPSAAMIGITSPALNETMASSSYVTPSSLADWYMMSNMRETLRDFGKANAGLIEASSDSPYANASTLIGNLVAPDMLDDSSTNYNTMDWTAMITATWLLEYPGDSIPNTLDGR